MILRSFTFAALGRSLKGHAPVSANAEGKSILVLDGSGSLGR